jgi:hypothetical protein
MATTTTNYGFDIPQSTDLVKDGATAIATLGQDIDTAMNTALGTKKAGMVLLNTTSFSAVSSVSINDVFTSTYKNYSIVVNLTTPAAGTPIIRFRLRAAGTDQSGANYYSVHEVIPNSGAATLIQEISQTSGRFGVLSSTAPSAFRIDIFEPQVNQRTNWTFQYVNNNLAEISQGGGNYRATYQADGFTLFPATSTFDAGTIQTYGWNQ